jgi:hypothetical protein
MTHAIVQITPPSNNADSQITSKWLSLLRKIEEHLKTTKDVVELAEGLWQVPLTTNSHTLALLVHGASTGSLRCRLLLLEDEPKWIEVPISNA